MCVFYSPFLSFFLFFWLNDRLNEIFFFFEDSSQSTLRPKESIKSKNMKLSEAPFLYINKNLVSALHSLVFFAFVFASRVKTQRTGLKKKNPSENNV